MVSRASFCTDCGAGLPGGSTPWLRPTCLPTPCSRPFSPSPRTLVLAAGSGRLAAESAARRAEPQREKPRAAASFRPIIRRSAAGRRRDAPRRSRAPAEAAPKDVATWKRLAEHEYRAGRVDKQYLAKAEKAFRHILELSPDDREPFAGSATRLSTANDYASAITHYSRYLELEPKDSGARTDLGTMYLYAGDVAKAIAEYQK